jgi:hypothetical protein
MDGMYLNDFKLCLALGAGDDFAFFDFFFVKVNLDGAFRTMDHGEHPPR